MYGSEMGRIYVTVQFLNIFEFSFGSPWVSIKNGDSVISAI